ncbi:Hsp70 family protein [Phytomonospora endophytica]|uniref:Molecular chaperone DnaK (HSP70) n=1 Tax=Phytomonospora endophytica TaxID=714109 RepID=A0A841FJR0_9ACTN|nr:Hsp70 family protein [Phytomonospora endophytica]MBB6035183.1 molecular chaperone DnaK (HSP70) [Phytomonospora endophytica]GIG64068.1 hypothetical protein Pen01_03630 [Phytomonospora endophytica]
MEPVLAVDFGTSTTVAVVRHGDGRSETILFDGAPTLPSAVFAKPGAGLLTGRDALAAGLAAPGRFEPHPKLHVDDEAVWLGVEVTVVDMFAAVLRRVANEAGPVGRVVLTHPAAWDETRRDTLLRAAGRAGLAPVTLVPEPVAAARYFDARSPGPVAVYDFGSGSFNVSVVAEGRVLAADGLDDLGGLDIDAAVVDLLDTTIEADDSAREAWSRLRSPRGPEDRRAWRRFAEDVRGAKELLSRTRQALLHIPMAERDVPLTREHLETIAEPLIRRTVATTRAALTTAGLTGAAGIYVVGGASRMPLVATLLHRILGIPTVTAAEPELVVARGASLLADEPAREVLLAHAAASMRALTTRRRRELATRPVEGTPVADRALERLPRPTASAPAAPAWRPSTRILLGLIAAGAVGVAGIVTLVLWKVAAG